MPHVIWDEEDRRAYVHRDYPTHEAAERERLGLLRPYPEGHPWRARLTVREGSCGVRERGRPTGRDADLRDERENFGDDGTESKEVPCLTS